MPPVPRVYWSSHKERADGEIVLHWLRANAMVGWMTYDPNSTCWISHGMWLHVADPHDFQIASVEEMAAGEFGPAIDNKVELTFPLRQAICMNMRFNCDTYGHYLTGKRMISPREVFDAAMYLRNLTVTDEVAFIQLPWHLISWKYEADGNDVIIHAGPVPPFEDHAGRFGMY